jgi:hypothetical protein
MLLTEVPTKMFFGYTVAAVAAALVPCAMLRLPSAGAVLLPHGPLIALMHSFPLLRRPIHVLLSLGALVLLPVLVSLLVLGMLTLLPVLFLCQLVGTFIL